MIRKDLIDRQVEELGRVLAKMLAEALGLKTDAGNIAESVKQAFQEQLGLDPDALAALSDPEFLEILQQTGKFDSANLEKLADLLAAIAHSGHENQTALYRKSMALYAYIDQVDRIFDPNRQAKIQQIRRLL